MSKEDFAKQISEEANITRDQARKTIEALFNGIETALNKDNGRIILTGFGSFSKSHQNARKGRNPQTGQEINIPARNVVKFKASKELLNEIN